MQTNILVKSGHDVGLDIIVKLAQPRKTRKGEKDMMQNLLKREKGFTLVELLIVIAIIAILAAIAIPQFSKYRMRGYKTGVDSDAKNIYTAAQAWLSDNPAGTVDTRAKLNTGGYQPSADVTFDSGTMTLATGDIQVHSVTLKAQAKDNNAVIFFNGRISQPNTPN
jgi:prepilin-type N-terminal cleavage/methylation domain-containing protein